MEIPLGARSMDKSARLWTFALACGLAFSAGYTVPSKDEMHQAAVAYADDAGTAVDRITARATGVFGNDAYDDYLFFGRYRIYFEQNVSIECYGAFGRFLCNRASPSAASWLAMSWQTVEAAALIATIIACLP